MRATRLWSVARLGLGGTRGSAGWGADACLLHVPCPGQGQRDGYRSAVLPARHDPGWKDRASRDFSDRDQALEAAGCSPSGRQIRTRIASVVSSSAQLRAGAVRDLMLVPSRRHAARFRGDLRIVDVAMWAIGKTRGIGPRWTPSIHGVEQSALLGLLVLPVAHGQSTSGGAGPRRRVPAGARSLVEARHVLAVIPETGAVKPAIRCTSSTYASTAVCAPGEQPRAIRRRAHSASSRGALKTDALRGGSSWRPQGLRRNSRGWVRRHFLVALATRLRLLNQAGGVAGGNCPGGLEDNGCSDVLTPS